MTLEPINEGDLFILTISNRGVRKTGHVLIATTNQLEGIVRGVFISSGEGSGYNKWTINSGYPGLVFDRDGCKKL